ncbi:12917_t:CDS:2 [Dentiscutata erythropus]|uniref:12917_t:CDS:1 n=1 Tax=Dentiscutata erythropus TaxID=1348616 RepID=A0A9N8WNU3_9GLOM|nr:12917_t:CDS:2 [Dentiscutata erythropus]
MTLADSVYSPVWGSILGLIIQTFMDTSDILLSCGCCGRGAAGAGIV